MDIEAASMAWTQDGGTYLDKQSLTVPLLASHLVACTFPKGCSYPAASCYLPSFLDPAKWKATEAQSHNRSHPGVHIRKRIRKLDMLQMWQHLFIIV
jgi:hypothetical protein